MPRIIVLRRPPPTASGELLHALVHLAASTQWRILRGGQLGVRPTEIGLTEELLLRLADRFDGRGLIRIHQFSGTEEGHDTGADWEWWIVSAAGAIGLRVQAKRLYDDSYHGLDRVSKAGKQAQLLVSSARRVGLLPVYCFYNGLDPASSPTPWVCCSLPANAALLGCSIAAAEKILPKIRGSRTPYATIAQVAVPLACLVRCPRRGAGPSGRAIDPRRATAEDGDLASRVLEFLWYLGCDPDRSVQPRSVETTPAYVRALLRGWVPEEAAPLGGTVRFAVVIDARRSGVR